jgi:peptide-methionine (S)-S-oxide reductase
MFQRGTAGKNNSRESEYPHMALEKATFGMGCFWHSEEIFRKVPGVVDTAVGFMGGTKENPTYKDVCTGKTGHAEVVEVIYDNERITYKEILDIFWASIDPTVKNMQGPDVGTQYRTAVFYHTQGQETLATKSKDELERSRKHRRPIVTQITPASTFWRAEEYHQRYFEKMGGSCRV